MNNIGPILTAIAVVIVVGFLPFLRHLSRPRVYDRRVQVPETASVPTRQQDSPERGAYSTDGALTLGPSSHTEEQDS